MATQQKKAKETAGSTATIQDVAVDAGVSTATVSRCLNQPDVVNLPTLERVRASIRKLGYEHPEPARRRGPRMATQSMPHRTLMFLWTHGKFPARSRTGQLLIHGVMGGLRRHGISLIVDQLDDQGYLPAAIKNGMVDGLFLHGPEPEKKIAEVLRELPTVWLFQIGGCTWGDRVQPDHRGIGAAAFDHLVASGASRLCCITFPPALPARDYTSRTEAFKQHAKATGVTCQVLETTYVPEEDTESGLREVQNAVQQFLALDPRPDGLFLPNHLGNAICAELENNGVLLGKELHVVTDNVEVFGMKPDLQVARIDDLAEDIGAMAADMLLWRMRNPRLPRATHLVSSVIRLPAAR
jgi:LacI family transcriptional regulator